MSAYREGIIRALTIAGVIFFLPFAVYSFYKGSYVVAVGICAMFVILAVDARANFQNRPLPISLQWIIVPIVPTITYAVYLDGFGPALWSYPAIVLFYFILARWEANLFAIVMVSVLTPMVYKANPRSISLRFAVTMLVTAIFGNLLINIVSGLQQKLMDLSILDPLTEAFNRRQMDTVLDLAIERTNRSETHASICIFDVDHFKRVNDTYGHAVGDDVLRELGNLLKSNVRGSDIACRFGGEEFVLLLPEATREVTRQRAETLRTCAKSLTVSHQGRPIEPISLSIGVAAFPADGATPAALLKSADDALYRAKREGRDRTAVAA